MSTQVALAPSSRVNSNSKSTSPMTTANSGLSKAAKLARLRQAPAKPEIQVDKTELKKRLTPLQYKVTQEKFTERAFSGEYVKLNDNGKYCCIVCNEELFSSECKFDSSCGWPVFYNVIDDKKVIQQADLSHVGGNLLLLALNQDLARTEVNCAKCGSHLGHVFDDGPKPTGKRYCVNSASLKFEHADSISCDRKQATDLEARCLAVGKIAAKTSEPSKSAPFLSKRSHNLMPVLANSKSLSSNDVVTRNIPSVKVLNKTNGITRDNATAISSNSTATVEVSGQVPPNQATSWKVGWFLGPSKTANAKLPENTNSAVEVVKGASDANNNRIVTGNRYSSVKSRYLNHLNSVSKEAVSRYTAKKAPVAETKLLLETDL